MADWHMFTAAGLAILAMAILGFYAWKGARR
jgi:hypothetical protein